MTYLIGECGSEWLERVRPIIQARMSRYAAEEVHFNLMALVASRQGKLERHIMDLQLRLSNGVSIILCYSVFFSERSARSRFDEKAMRMGQSSGQLSNIF